MTPDKNEEFDPTIPAHIREADKFLRTDFLDRVERLNQVTLRLLNYLRDGHLSSDGFDCDFGEFAMYCVGCCELLSRHYWLIRKREWPKRGMALWRITGEASSDSGGGNAIYYVVTNDSTDIPDVHMAVHEASKGKYRVNRVESIELIHELSEFDFPGEFQLEREVANQSIYPIYWGLLDAVCCLMCKCADLSDKQDCRSAKMPENIDDIDDDSRPPAPDQFSEEKPAIHLFGGAAMFFGVRIHWDGGSENEKVYNLIRDLGGHFRVRLIAVRSRGDMVDLMWDGSPPKGLRKRDDQFVTAAGLKLGQSRSFAW